MDLRPLRNLHHQLKETRRRKHRLHLCHFVALLDSRKILSLPKRVCTRLFLSNKSQTSQEYVCSSSVSTESRLSRSLLKPRVKTRSREIPPRPMFKATIEKKAKDDIIHVIQQSLCPADSNQRWKKRFVNSPVFPQDAEDPLVLPSCTTTQQLLLQEHEPQMETHWVAQPCVSYLLPPPPTTSSRCITGFWMCAARAAVWAPSRCLDHCSTTGKLSKAASFHFVASVLVWTKGNKEEEVWVQTVCSQDI